MEPEIAILYGDLSIVRLPWDLKSDFKHTGVIAIALIQPGARKRHQSLIEHDYYFLVWTDTDCCLFGHDGDDGFFNFEKPGQADWRFPFLFYDNTIMFEGETIRASEYAKAKLIFGDPDGSMY